MKFVAENLNRVEFRRRLIRWFNKNKRHLPWRDQQHWYPTFLSEFLLQQTQIEQALPYFEKFIRQYPSVDILATATEQEVLKLWAGLGYYARARNLLKAAKFIAENFQGSFPTNLKQALALPGIGDYTAAAILSIAFNMPLAVMDGNVQRVITRLFAIKEDLRLEKTKKSIRHICNELLDLKRPALFNEALMELGAVICKPQKPNCILCPVHRFCQAYEMDQVELYPYKSAPAAKKKIYQYVFVISFRNYFLVVKRPPKGLLASMWEFPTLSVDKLDLKDEELVDRLNQKYLIEAGLILKGGNFRHTYTHLQLTYLPLLMKAKRKKIQKGSDYVEFTWKSLQDLTSLPIHHAHLKIIQWLKSLKN